MQQQWYSDATGAGGWGGLQRITLFLSQLLKYCKRSNQS